MERVSVRLMGGKKKLSLKQATQAQTRKEKQERKKKEKPALREKKPASVISPQASDTKIVNEVKKMSVLTPYAVATRFNLRISAAKGFLQQMEERGLIERVSGNHNLKIYRPVG